MSAKPYERIGSLAKKVNPERFYFTERNVGYDFFFFFFFFFRIHCSMSLVFGKRNSSGVITVVSEWIGTVAAVGVVSKPRSDHVLTSSTSYFFQF